MIPKRSGRRDKILEDVKVGEELKPLIVGLFRCRISAPAMQPLTHAVAFDIEWERIKLNPPFHWLDPEVNAWTCSGICHVCDDKGHARVWDGGAQCHSTSRLNGCSAG